MLARHCTAPVSFVAGAHPSIRRPNMSPRHLGSTPLLTHGKHIRRIHTSSCHRMRVDFDPPLFFGTLAVGAMAYTLWDSKPRGEVEQLPILGVSNSTVPNAGLGLFLLESRVKGTVLGSYPGRVWGASEWLRYKGDSMVQYRARQYVWRLGNGNIVDPTNELGYLEDFVPWTLPFGFRMPVTGPSTVLARINEPGRFGDTNVITEDRGDELLLILERTVSAGEELLMDYGPYYDRTHYGGPGTLMFADD